MPDEPPRLAVRFAVRYGPTWTTACVPAVLRDWTSARTGSLAPGTPVARNRVLPWVKNTLSVAFCRGLADRADGHPRALRDELVEGVVDELIGDEGARGVLPLVEALDDPEVRRDVPGRLDQVAVRLERELHGHVQQVADRRGRQELTPFEVLEGQAAGRPPGGGVPAAVRKPSR